MIAYDKKHPTAFIETEVINLIRSEGAAAEANRDLTNEQLKLIHEHNWFNMFVPKAFGGSAMSLPEVLKIEECLAWADGSTGWVTTLCSGAAWFSGFLDHTISKKIFLNKDRPVFAGSGAPTGTASKSIDGYVVNGVWKYASGALHATVFTANCRIEEDNRPCYNKDGTPLIRAFVFFRDEVTVHHTWNSMGMIATGSHSFEVKNLIVPENRCFQIDPTYAQHPDVIYQFPFLQLAETTLAVNLSGMALRFLDLCMESLEKKKTPSALSVNVQHDATLILANAKTKLELHRENFFRRTEKYWKLFSNQNMGPHDLEELSEVSHRLVRVSREVVNEVYPYCGLNAADATQDINRVWRDFHTASLHSLFNRQEGNTSRQSNTKMQ